MKRTKSSLSLRNLAMSIKQSIQLQADRTAKKQYGHLKATKSFANLISKERNSQPIKLQQTLNKEQKQNRVFVLEKQIANLQRQLKDSERQKKDYSKDLNAFDQMQKKLEQCQNDLSSELSSVQQIKNQILMLQQQIYSTQFNIQDRLAEKQYHQQLIDAYENQYESQSKFTMNIIHLQEDNQTKMEDIKGLQMRIERANNQLKEWKDYIELDLNQHKLKNNIKILKMKLIGFQDQCDKFCNQNQLRKIRQLYCLYFKNYSKIHGVPNEQIEEGIDIFICKNGLCEDFSEFIRERLVYNKPKFPLFEEYLQTLLKMEQIYRKSIFEANKKVHTSLLANVKQLQKQRQQKKNQIQQNKQKIKKITQQIQDLFNNQSIAVIQYLRERNNNKYDIKEIKAKLRENKKQQRKRIQKIRDSYTKIKELQMILQKSNIQQVKKKRQQQIIQLTQSLLQSELHLSELQNKQKESQKEKERIEDKISSEITKWRQLDEKKVKLTNLYKQLDQANRNKIVQSNYQIKRTKNYIEVNNHEQINANNSIRKHSKNTSICSLNQSKSILSLNNPFKKMIQKSKQMYEPILTNCQMILSKKLTHKDLQIKDLQQRNSKALQQKNKIQSIPNSQIKQSKCPQKANDKQNNIWVTRNKSLTMTASKLTISPLTNHTKGKVCMSQRQSLSKLLISKFGR